MSEETNPMAGYVGSLSEAEPEQADSLAEVAPAPEPTAEKFAVTPTQIVEQVRAFAENESSQPDQKASLALPDWDADKMTSGFTEQDVEQLTTAEKRGVLLVENSQFAAEIVHHLFKLKEVAGDNPKMSLLVDYTLAGLTRSKADMDALVPPEQFAELMSASLGELIPGYKELEPEEQAQVAALYQNLLGNLSQYRDHAIALYDVKAPDGQKFKDIEDEFTKLTIVLQYDALQRTFDATDAGVDDALRIQANKNSAPEKSTAQDDEEQAAGQDKAQSLYEQAVSFINSAGGAEKTAASEAVERGGDFLVGWAAMMFDSSSGIRMREAHGAHEIDKNVAEKLITHWQKENNFHELIVSLKQEGVIDADDTIEAIDQLMQKTKDPAEKDKIDKALAKIKVAKYNLFPNGVNVESIVFSEWFCKKLKDNFVLDAAPQPQKHLLP